MASDPKSTAALPGIIEPPTYKLPPIPIPPLTTCNAPVLVLAAAVELSTVNVAPDNNAPAVAANPTCTLPVLVYVGALVPELTNN